MPGNAVSQRLMSALHFTQEDLELNKRGTLSLAQKENLQQKLQKYQNNWKIILTGIAASFLLAVFKKVGNNMPLAIGFIVGGGLFYYIIFRSIKNHSEKRQENISNNHIPVKTLEGSIKKSMQNSNPKAYIIEIQGTKIYVLEPEIFEAFDQNGSYRIYCSEDNIPLSAEPLVHI